MEEKDKTLHGVYARMAKLCSRSEQCSSDIRQKIMASGITHEDADKIIEMLQSERYIDDGRYIRSYVADKFKFNRWGKIKIRHYLKMKGFPEGLIQQGLEGIDENKYRQTLLKTMKEKARAVKKKDKFEKMGQLIRFAQNRGFEPELIHRYLHEVLE